MTLFTRTDRSFLSRWWWTLDRPLLAALLVMMGVGAMLVATASPPVAKHLGLHPYHFLFRHMIVLGPALVLLLGVSMLSPRWVWRVASVLFVIAVGFMVAVLFHGLEIKGAQRWIDLGAFSLQPSEFIKPGFAICAAWFMAGQKTERNFTGHKIAAGFYALTIFLLLLQPDFGMTFVVSCMFGAQIVLAGLPIRLMLILLGVGVLGIGAAYVSFDHVQSRIDRFLDPASGDNYQVERALEAFRAGGVLGTGPGHGTVKEGLPDAHADFIFAVAGEELGLVFVVPLIALYAFIVMRGLSRLMQGAELFALLAAGGLLTMFGLQAVIHMGSALQVLPAKGMTLPFISYGGSSLLAMGFTMGAVLAFTRREGRPSAARGGLSVGSV
ncbi:MAG: putative lipid II flippase FtsW [Alphaproteobacteria bacterium]|nr:putative lipid II flippase FtsW [Alphaproteobacteria bacterium]